MWGIVILAQVLNIVIITAVNITQIFLWLLIISIALLIMAVYRVLQGNPSFLPCLESSKSFKRRIPYELLSHSIYPTKITDDDLRVIIGNDQCSNPYDSCLISIEAWKNSNYTRLAYPELNGKEFETRGNINLSFPTIWQADVAYQKCRIENGAFDSLSFKSIARMSGVKMIEINLNSQVKADYLVDSILEISKPVGAKGKPDLFTSSEYTTFRDAEGLVHFIENLRNLSGGKPVGIRLSMNEKKDFRKICYAIQKTQIIPDFIVVTGSSEKAAFSQSDSLFYPVMSLYEALLFISQTLETYGLDEDIKVIAEGEVTSGFDILRLLALGANSVCINCTCFNIPEIGNKHEIKSPQWNSHIHYRLMRELVQIMNVGGFRSVKDVTLSKVFGQLDVLHSNRNIQTEEQVLFRNPVKKMFDDKINKIEPENRKSREKISLQ